MSLQPISFTSLTIPALVSVHNELAIERGETPIKSWHESHCKLAQRVAILRTLPKKPTIEPTKGATRTRPTKSTAPIQPKKRKQPVRDAILEALAFVSHYEDATTGQYVSKHRRRHWRGKLISVGLPYREVEKRVRRKLPKVRVSGVFMRWTAAMVRKGEPGFENCKLPQKRPHGTKRKMK